MTSLFPGIAPDPTPRPKRKPNAFEEPKFVGATALAKEFGVNRKTIRRYRMQYKDFPGPNSDDLYDLEAVKLWWRKNVTMEAHADHVAANTEEAEAMIKRWQVVERKAKALGAEMALEKLKGFLIPRAQYEADMQALCHVFRRATESRVARLAAKISQRTEDECRAILEEDARQLGHQLGQQTDAIEVRDTDLESVETWLHPDEPETPGASERSEASPKTQEEDT